MKLRAVILSLAVCTALLTGCGPTTPPEASPDAGSPSPIETVAPPAEASLPDLSGSELLTVTTTATAPTGETLDVTLTVYVPIETGTAEAAQIDAWLTAQGDTSGVLQAAIDSGGVLQLMDLDAAAGSGTWPGDAVGVTGVYGADQLDTVVGVPTAELNGSLRKAITGPGEGHVVSAIGQATVFDWADRFMFYGFFDGIDDVVLSGCDIQKTAKADDYPAIANWGEDICTIGLGD
jgi:hypothetical protein